MKFVRRSHKDIEVNLTPLIDVVFILLIFFMISTTFTTQNHLEIDLPEAFGKFNVSKKNVRIAINRAGDVAVNDLLLFKPNSNELGEAIKKISGGDTDVAIEVSADFNTPHQWVVTALDAAGQLGFSSVSIITRRPVKTERL